jgi:hypothetical protein
MHAWSEVEHDLVYKPLEGNLSEEEYLILDQLNGMVIAGEMALETLQRAGERRVAEGERAFVNHYEVAAHLLSRAEDMLGQSIGDAGLGRIDLLFALLRRLKLDTPARLTKYLGVLHGNLEVRSLAEQVIDAILADDESRYDVYRTIQEEAGERRTEPDSNDREFHMHMGFFMARWAELESLVRTLTPTKDESGQLMPTFRLIEQLNFLNADIRQEIESLRQLRNMVAHGRLTGITENQLVEATQRFDSITKEIRRRISPENP